MTELIIAGGMLGTLYLTIFAFCFTLAFQCADFKVKPLRSILSIVIVGFKESLIVSLWSLVVVTGLFALLSPLLLALYFVGFFSEV